VNTPVSRDGSVGPVREALMVCAAAGMQGVLRVTGNPGGVIHLIDGRVAAIETPGAPSPEVLLLRSHRVTESGWDAAFAAAAASGGRMSAELIARKMIGSGELEALLRTALADAIFVLANGTVQDYRAEPGPVDFVLPLEPGAEPDELLAEASRRMRVVASLPVRYYRDQIVALPDAARSGSRLGDVQDEILALANGRRTPRDLAFATGRGVYATMLQLARMHQAGLLATGSSLASEVVRREPGHPALGDQTQAGALLPRRQRDLSVSPRHRRMPGRARELRTSLGLLRPRSGRDADSGETSLLRNQGP
jgi:hypothetical protein